MREESSMCVPSAVAMGAAPAHSQIVPLRNLRVDWVLTAIPNGAVKPLMSLSLPLFVEELTAVGNQQLQVALIGAIDGGVIDLG